MTNTDWQAELGAKTTEALGRFGVAGRVDVERHLVWLIGHGPTVEVRLTESDVSAATQSPTELLALAERLARELSRARRRATGQTSARDSWLAWLRLPVPLALLAIGLWLAFRYLQPKPSATDGSQPKDHQVRGSHSASARFADKQVLDVQNCQRTVTRIQQGGTVTPLDIDGWVVELSLIGTQVTLVPSAPALDQHFPTRPGGRERSHHSVHTPILNQADATQSLVLISNEPLSTVTPQPGSGVVITWHGQYVAPYFQPNERSEYIRLAGVLFEDLKASYGALYARCAQSPARYLGSWFRGPDVGAALWMLVAEMEIASGSARLRLSAESSQTDEVRSALGRLAATVHPITRKRAAYVLASSGGTVSEKLGRYASVEFPFAPGNRANLASSSIAHQVWP